MHGVSVRGISKSFGQQHVLKSIDLEIAPGEFTVLLGPSGCGKSTLLNVIAGLDESDAGQIRIGSKLVTDIESSKRGIAMVFQSYALYPTMTVRRNLSFGLTVKSVPKPEIERRVAETSEMLQISEFLDRKPAQLSGGQRQRVAIGRALVQNANVCLFDEPLSNLDAKLRTEMRIEIKRLHTELGTTMIFVTHDQIEAMTLATRVAVMRAGKVEQYDAPHVLYETPETLFVAGFVGSPGMNFIDCTMAATGAATAVSPDLRLPLGAYPLRVPVANGEAVVVGIRPEHIMLFEPDVHGADAGKSLAVVDAETLFTEPLGADTLGWFKVGGLRLSARLQPRRARSLSGPVKLVFDLDHLSVFSKATGLRL